MNNYLGETTVEQNDTKFKDFGRLEWAMYFLERYAGYDGSHHKDWVFDQMARIMKGTDVIVSEATWKKDDDSLHSEYRISTDEPSQEYLDWVGEMCDGEDGPNTYSYDEGIAP